MHIISDPVAYYQNHNHFAALRKRASILISADLKTEACVLHRFEMRLSKVNNKITRSSFAKSNLHFIEGSACAKRKIKLHLSRLMTLWLSCCPFLSRLGLSSAIAGLAAESACFRALSGSAAQR